MSASVPRIPRGVWPVFAKPPAPSPRLPGRPRYSQVPGGGIASSMNRALETDMRGRVERRMAAVALAAQLYRADHGGAWPAKLEDLVPQYLPAVPRDPLAPGDTPLRYLLVKHGRPDGQDRPVVYSVGSNGNDDTHDAGAPLPLTPQYSWSNGPDEVRDLTRWSPRPTTLPASQP